MEVLFHILAVLVVVSVVGLVMGAGLVLYALFWRVKREREGWRDGSGEW
jgi:hypothetical protein